MMFSVNLCNLLEVTSGKRLTSDLATQWIDDVDDPYELHVSNPEYAKIKVPDPGPEQELSILSKPIKILAQSNAYPYGLTNDKIERLEEAGYETIMDIAEATDETILSIYMIGPRSLSRIRDVIYQAIWM
ncbi:hypothetical protein [Tardiphaga robiniae]|uniref:RNA polymerase alpha subunit C-terminal domain-containing protein n=1 Tax=Tardiphaga robiniae TaxID=943830 RepID=A0A7G6U7M0_9BRAD|nr:hypothetical protein [Tardiphaga robiniae]QND75002.1 hypothetical protein HB776_30125 [Tardiphaga robiniae]